MSYRHFRRMTENMAVDLLIAHTETGSTRRIVMANLCAHLRAEHAARVFAAFQCLAFAAYAFEVGADYANEVSCGSRFDTRRGWTEL